MADTKKDLVIQYLQKFPHVATVTLAKKIYSENNLLFPNLEAARTCVRRVRGAGGVKNRKFSHTEEFHRSKEEVDEKRLNPFGLPESHADEWKPIPFPIKKGRGITLWDPHIPYHDVYAITLALKWAQENRYTDFIFLGGDIQDALELSKFEKNPTQRTWKQEIENVNVFLDALENEFSGAQIIYKRGNHDFRLERYLRLKAPAIFDCAEYLWKDRLKIKERGIIVVEHDVPLQVGKLNIIHGHELQGSQSQVNPARGAYLKSGECVLEGHFHRSSEHSEPTMSRKLNTAWSVGCLCCLWPEWSRLNKWNHGCAGLEVNGKDFEVQNMRIITSEGIVR